MGIVSPFGTVPLVDFLRSPLRCFIRFRVTLVAGVGSAQLDRQIGARDSQAVIAPGVDSHVSLGRHVALHAGRPFAANLVVVMARNIVLGFQVTLGAEFVAFEF